MSDPNRSLGRPAPAEAPEPADDADLVAATMEGDLAAFEELVRRYQQGIYNVAFYKSKNRFDAEDLAQDIFLAAYKALPTLKEPANFGGWIFGIAYNRCHKWYQRERTKVIKFREVCRQVEQEQRAERAGRGGENDDRARLSELLRRLPDEIRDALRLKYLEGLSYDEIRERMGGIPHHRIDYLIRKGKRLIRERWGSADGDDDSVPPGTGA